MKYVLAISAALAFACVADAQCANGRCLTPLRPANVVHNVLDRVENVVDHVLPHRQCFGPSCPCNAGPQVQTVIPKWDILYWDASLKSYVTVAPKDPNVKKIYLNKKTGIYHETPQVEATPVRKSSPPVPPATPQKPKK